MKNSKMCFKQFYSQIDSIVKKENIDDRYEKCKKVLGFTIYRVYRMLEENLPGDQKWLNKTMNAKMSLTISLKQLDYQESKNIKDIENISELHKNNIIDNLAFVSILNYKLPDKPSRIFESINFGNKIKSTNHKSEILLVTYESFDDKKFKPEMRKKFKKAMLAYELAKKEFLKYI